MKITLKKPKNTEAESKSGIPSGIQSGIPSGDSSGVSKENTNLAKAQKIVDLGYSKRSLSTLERLSAQELDFILREKRDPEKDELSKKTIESSKEVVKAYIESLEAIKQARANESLNKGLVTLAQSNSTALSEVVGTNTGGRVGLIILTITSIALALDSIIGFDRLKKMFSKKNKETKKAANEN